MNVPRPRRVSGRILAVAVLSVGVAVGALGVWWMARARPSPGGYVDVLALGGSAAVAVRHEHDGTRSFVELIDAGRARWNALVPRYAEPPKGVGLSASPDAVTVRVVRGGLPEVFALAAKDAAKLGGILLAPDRPPHATGYTLPGVATVTEGGYAIEVLGEEGVWAELVAIRQQDGKPAWRRDLGAERIEVVGKNLPWEQPPHSQNRPYVYVRQRTMVRELDLATGEVIATRAVDASSPRPPDVTASWMRDVGADPSTVVSLWLGDPRRGLLFDPASRVMIAVDGERAVARVRWPALARAPQPHNAAEGALWMVLPDRLVLLNPFSLAPVLAVGGPVPELEYLEVPK